MWVSILGIGFRVLFIETNNDYFYLSLILSMNYFIVLDYNEFSKFII